MNCEPYAHAEHNEAAAEVLYTEWQGNTKYTYYDDGVVKITRYKSRRKIYWGRIIAALVVFVLLVMGIAQLIKACVKAVENDSNEIQANGNVAAVSDSSGAEGASVQGDSSDSASDGESLIDYSSVDITVCIDAGHGGTDVGTASSDGASESSQNLEIALLVKEYLESCGVSVIMTRDSDEQVSLSERCEAANQAGADFFVSIHRNSVSDGSDVSGVEAWVHNSKPQYDRTLAKNILSALEEVGVSDNLGVKYGYNGIPTANYQVNSGTIMPSCLLELGYMTSDSDNALFESNKQEYAEAIGNAIINTAVELGVVDENGERFLNEQLISSEKSEVTEQQENGGE